MVVCNQKSAKKSETKSNIHRLATGQRRTIMKKLTTGQIENAVKDGIEALEKNPGKTFALVYPFGFVPNAYNWPAPAERVKVYRDGEHHVQTYDLKRSHGQSGQHITLWK